ncbi:NHLP bacteriocin system secretion protein, partial [Salibacteraceae bacterium]|nr:NHLP bacteriocin system secretion protein [Salibacteraceae bacterium]
NTRLMLFEIEQQNLVLLNELEEMQLSMFELGKQNELELNNLSAQIIDLEAGLAEMNAKYGLNSEIKSPYSGTVIELMVDAGSIVSPGSYILSVERDQKDQRLEAIVYVSPNEGKKIKAGMEAKISPSTVEIEKFGYMRGKVLQVSEYPSTSAGMLNTLGTKELVATFAQGLPPIAVRVRLEKSKETPSGFNWTSGDGPKLEVKSGTLCNSQIIVHNKRPISLIFPTLE